MDEDEVMSDAPSPYGDFSGQYIDGAWRPGRSGKTLVDLNPYDDAPLAEIALANAVESG